MTLEEELKFLEIAAARARVQHFIGLAQAFENVAETLQRELDLVAEQDAETLSALQKRISRSPALSERMTKAA